MGPHRSTDLGSLRIGNRMSTTDPPSRRVLASSVTSAVSAGLVAVVALGLARWLGPAEFGTYTVVSTVAVAGSGLLTWNVGMAVMHRLPTADPVQATRLMGTALSVVLTTIGVVSIAMIGIGKLLYVAWGIPTEITWHAFALAVAQSINALGDCSLRGRRRFATSAAVRLAAAVGYALIAMVMLLRGVRHCLPFVDAFAVVTVVAGATACLIAGARPHGWVRSSVHELYGHGMPVTLTSLLISVLFTVDSMMLMHYAGPAAVGVYSVYNGMPRRLAGILMNDGVGLALLPRLAVIDTRMALQWVRDHTPLLLGAGTLGFAVVCVPLCLLVGDQYGFSVVAMVISGAGIAMHCLMILLGFVLTMDGSHGSRSHLVAVSLGFPVGIVCLWVIIRSATPMAGLWAFAAASAVISSAIALIAGWNQDRGGAREGTRR